VVKSTAPKYMYHGISEPWNMVFWGGTFYHGKKYRPKIPRTVVFRYLNVVFWGGTFYHGKKYRPKIMLKSTAPKYHVPWYSGTMVHGILGRYFLPWYRNTMVMYHGRPTWYFGSVLFTMVSVPWYMVVPW